ncbi:MAG: 3-isopropylmalate dehydratase small subunit [Xanthobacteraceae bacterium]|jgi:3-isopropylmalate/(R)-2-methylmalate dehydratase small subunit
MQPFSTHSGIAAPLLVDDMNTDQIAPFLPSRSLKDDYKVMLFNRQRFREDGGEIPDFVLNKPQFRSAGILVTGNNFGAGSSRESAVWSMLANNIRVIVAKSFADIYRENCLQNGLLPIVLDAGVADAFIARVVAADGATPFTVDLVTQRISGPGGPDISFEIPGADRTRLLEGLDDIGMTMKHVDEIVSWEREAAEAQPWLQQAADHRRWTIPPGTSGNNDRSQAPASTSPDRSGRHACRSKP